MLLMLVDVCVLPLGGCTRFKVAVGIVTLVAYTTIRCPEVALKLRRMSCPATVVLAVTAEPSIAIVPVTSESLLIEIETLPVAVPCGLIKI